MLPPLMLNGPRYAHRRWEQQICKFDGIAVLGRQTHKDWRLATRLTPFVASGLIAAVPVPGPILSVAAARVGDRVVVPNDVPNLISVMGAQPVVCVERRRINDGFGHEHLRRSDQYARSQSIPKERERDGTSLLSLKESNFGTIHDARSARQSLRATADSDDRPPRLSSFAAIFCVWMRRTRGRGDSSPAIRKRSFAGAFLRPK